MQLVTIVGEPVSARVVWSPSFAYIDVLLELLVRWRTGRCLPYGDGITFWALGEIVKAEAGIFESDDPGTPAASSTRCFSDGADAAWLEERL